MAGAGELALRSATAADAGRLRELLAAAKGHWGYPPEQVRAWADSLDLLVTVRAQEVWIAEAAGEAVAWAGLAPPVDGLAVLEHLWVAPAWMGRGIGTRLFRRAAARAAELGAVRMEWEAEPNALAFYRKMGGVPVRRVTSEWGRSIDVMAVPVQADSRSAR